jgi:hypothetical protein
MRPLPTTGPDNANDMTRALNLSARAPLTDTTLAGVKRDVTSPHCGWYGLRSPPTRC